MKDLWNAVNKSCSETHHPRGNRKAPSFLPEQNRATRRAAARHDAAGMAATGVVSMAASTVEVLEEVQPGDGKRFPKTGDKVVVHYTGSLRSATRPTASEASAALPTTVCVRPRRSSGKVFDCSRERGHAFTFQLGVGRVIKGWDDGVRRLSLGQRVKLLVPWADAYGEKGQPPRIPPRADLVFDVELKNINETLVDESVRYRKEEQARAEKVLKQLLVPFVYESKD